MKFAKKILVALFMLAALCMAAAFAAFFYVKDATSALDEIQNEKIMRIKIERGTTAREVAAKLGQNGMIKNERVFYLLARFPNLAYLIFPNARPGIFTVKAGVCEISSAMDAARIYSVISAGLDEQTKISIPEGLTISKIAERFEAAGICSAKEFSSACRDENFLKEIALPFKSAEGYLFPDTYSFVPNSDAKSCVRAMVKNFFEKTSGIKNFADASEERRNQIVILASVVEREYRVADEAPMIASVFSNRIKNHIGLYSCATVEYVITEILGRPHPDIITFDDLKIESPYNTYLHEGLPPAPISNPGLVALSAAANPAQSDFFYFRLMDEEEGRHVFTKTLEEHEMQNLIFKTKKMSR
ncbi:MAG: endolytic transglycosylase MltG [Treponemataceae bacterium]|nr:endolytic transglycosylase MltG [Treponemataceae bacterium]